MSESMRPPSEKAWAKLASEMAKPLAGYHPDVQGAAIANMVVVWLGTVSPERREQAFDKFIEVVRATIADITKEPPRHAP